jgi:hypothetical protein
MLEMNPCLRAVPHRRTADKIVSGQKQRLICPGRERIYSAEAKPPLSS